MDYKNNLTKTYNQLSPKQKEDPIFLYLAHFNAIDKYFDKLLKQDKFLPYNEKIKRVIHGDYYISWFVKLHEYQLKYFGELRNHIIHGVKLDGKTYAMPTAYALDKIEKFKEAILTPPSCFNLFQQEVFTCKTTDYLKHVLPVMKQHRYTHVPVYNAQGKFVGVLTEGNITYWLADHLGKSGSDSMDSIKVAHIPLDHTVDDYLFVSKQKNIYEIDQFFTLKRKENNPLGAIFITEHGKENETIEGMITAGDVALVDMYVIH